MKEMYKEWSTAIRQFEVYDIISNSIKTFPIGAKLEWQRIEDDNYIQIMSDNYADVIKCGNFKIEQCLVRDKMVKQMAEEASQEVKRFEDSFEITEPTELQKEQARKIMGRETQTEIIINYLNSIDLNVVNPQVEQWIEQQKTKYSSRLDTINFCNTSDKDIISEALISFSNNYRAEGKHTEANKVDTVRKNYLDSFKETKEAE